MTVSLLVFPHLSHGISVLQGVFVQLAVGITQCAERCLFSKRQLLRESEAKCLECFRILFCLVFLSCPV